MANTSHLQPLLLKTDRERHLDARDLGHPEVHGNGRVIPTRNGLLVRSQRLRVGSQEAGLILLCGHYEGFDERIIEGLQPLEISVGDFVLTGGEIPAMAVLDSVTRLIPGVLGAEVPWLFEY